MKTKVNAVEKVIELRNQFIECQKQYGGEFEYNENGEICGVKNIPLPEDLMELLIGKINNIKPFSEETRTTKKGIDDFLLSNAGSFRRFELFHQYKDRVTATVYWHGLATAYTDSDNLYHYREEVRECFSSQTPYRHNLMNKKEKAYLASLGDRVTIYRAMTLEEEESGEYGISWTLKYDVAEFFKNDYQRNYSTAELERTIVSMEIDTDRVIALFLGRDEHEVIVLL